LVHLYERVVLPIPYPSSIDADEEIHGSPQMDGLESREHDWKSKWRVFLTCGLIVVATFGLNLLSHGAPVPLRKQMVDFPQAFGEWKGVDVPIDDRTREVLGATDILNRVYSTPGANSLGFFVAFFSNQRKGGAVHSPKNCLPGAGWFVSKSGTVRVTIPDRPHSIVVNEYIIQRDLNRDVVLYWYQSQGRIVASEYSAKFYLIWDALKKNRTDGALVRVITPIRDGDEKAARWEAERFVQATFSPLTNYIPN
jgi:EpsI family protein